MKNSIDDLILNIGNFTEVGDSVIIPNYSAKKLIAYTTAVVDEKIKLTEDETFSLGLISKTTSNLNAKDRGVREDSTTLVNEVNNSDGTKITMRSLGLEKSSKSSKSAILKLRKQVGIGSPVTVPLIHSGFIITLSAMKNTEIINLELDIVEKLNTIGKKTNTLGLSHYEVILSELILDTALEHVVTTTLELTEDDDIRKYININDIEIIAWGFAKTMFPDGWYGVLPCVNVTNIEDGKPVCSTMVKKHVDMDELFHFNNNILTDKQRIQLARTGKNSVTTIDALTYQEQLENIAPNTIVYDLEGAPLEITYKSPNAETYFTYGNLFIEQLKELCIDIVVNKENMDVHDAENMLLEETELQVFNHFIATISYDGIPMSDLQDINEILEIIKSTPVVRKKVMDDCLSYIDKSTVSSIGNPGYVCPNCIEKGKDSDKTYSPLSVYSIFFTLLRMKYDRILSKVEQKQNVSTND